MHGRSSCWGFPKKSPGAATREKGRSRKRGKLKNWGGGSQKMNGTGVHKWDPRKGRESRGDETEVERGTMGGRYLSRQWKEELGT